MASFRKNTAGRPTDAPYKQDAPDKQRDRAHRVDDRRVLAWICRVARPELPTVAAIVLGEALWAVLGTVTALFSREIVNGATEGLKSKMFLYLGIYLAVALSLIGVHSVMRYVTERCKAKLEILFRGRLFEAMLTRSYPALKEHHTGELVNRLAGDVTVISDAATTILPNIVMMTVRLVAAMAVLIHLEWRFALVFAAGGVLMFCSARFLKRRVQGYHRSMQEKEGKVCSFWQEVFENLIVVKAFAGEKMSAKKSELLLEEHYKVRMKRSLVSTLSMFGTAFIVRLGHIFAIGYGAFCLLSGKMDYGTLTALTQLVSQVQQPFANMSGIMPRYYAALSSAERLMEMEELADDSNTEAGAVNAAETYRRMKYIDVRGVEFSYDRDNIVLENCCCRIHKGDFISITGMSGIGKSTLFKLLLDVYPKRAGELCLVSENGGEIPINGNTRPLFAYVPQGNMLFSGTIRENLCFLAAENAEDEAIRKALVCACADSFLDELPEGLDTVIGEQGIGLSEGQIQRLSVARAILSGAPILLFDEATSALDEATEAALLSNLRAMTDRTCVIVTHKKAALDICNRHFIIRDRKIEEI